MASQESKVPSSKSCWYGVDDFCGAPDCIFLSYAAQILATPCPSIDEVNRARQLVVDYEKYQKASKILTQVENAKRIKLSILQDKDDDKSASLRAVLATLKARTKQPDQDQEGDQKDCTNWVLDKWITENKECTWLPKVALLYSAIGGCLAPSPSAPSTSGALWCYLEDILSPCQEGLGIVSSTCYSSARDAMNMKDAMSFRRDLKRFVYYDYRSKYDQIFLDSEWEEFFQFMKVYCCVGL